MTSRFNLLAIAVCMSVAALVPCVAQAADAARVEKLLTIIKPEKQLEQMRGIFLQSFEGGFVAAAMKKGATPAEIERERNIVVPALTKALDQAFSGDFIHDRIARIYSEELTNDEIDAAIAFYSSPQGQSMLTKMPELMKRSAEAGQERAREMAPTIDAIMQDAIRQVREQERKESGAKVDDAVKQVHDAAMKDAQGANAASTANDASQQGSQAQPGKP